MRLERPALLSLLALALVGCAPTAQAPSRAAALALVECRWPGVSGTARCGTWTVLEDRTQPEGRTIDLQVVVLPATGRPVRPDPVFFLAGGPGQGATEVMGPAVGMLGEANEHRDLVFVDQRGTGGSHKLGCPPAAATDIAARLALDTDLAEVAACLAGLDADTTAYTTPAFVADLDAVRDALGYGAINLYGGSYGTRAGLAYLAAHEDRVRSAVFDGNAPYDLKLFLTFGEDGRLALERLFADCAAESSCAAAFPALGARFWAWLDGLPGPHAPEIPPRLVTVRDPSTGTRALEVPITRDAVAGAIRGLLYSIEMASLLPLSLDRAISGDLEPLLGQALVLGEGADDAMAPGLMMSVACAEDIPRITAEERAAVAAEPFLGASLLTMFTEACGQWRAGSVPAQLFAPVVSDVPVLLLSGAEDPVTPERWAEVAAHTLANAHLLTVPATGHIAASAPCVDELIDGFYEAPSEAPSPEVCITERARPPFFIDFTGPTP